MKKCRICESENNLIQHHNSYFPERIITVCKRCHRIIHSGLNQAQLIEIALLVGRHGGQWHEDFERFIKEKGYSRVSNKLDEIEDVIAEKEMAIDLLTNWEGEFNLEQ
jgi:hypothetical protein